MLGYAGAKGCRLDLEHAGRHQHRPDNQHDTSLGKLRFGVGYMLGEGDHRRVQRGSPEEYVGQQQSGVVWFVWPALGSGDVPAPEHPRQ